MKVGNEMRLECFQLLSVNVFIKFLDLSKDTLDCCMTCNSISSAEEIPIIDNSILFVHSHQNSTSFDYLY